MKFNQFNHIIIALAFAAGGAHAQSQNGQNVEPGAFELLESCDKKWPNITTTCHAYSAAYLAEPGRRHVVEQFAGLCAVSNIVSVEQCREVERAREIINKKLRKEANSK